MSKLEAEQCLKLPIFYLKKHGYLKPFSLGTLSWISPNNNKQSIGYLISLKHNKNYIQLIYSKVDKGGNENHFNYKVPIVSSPCNLDGKRYWFVCPLSKNGKSCLRRTGILYKPYYADYFGCRYCYDLTYNSRNLSGIEKQTGRIISIPELEKMESEAKRKYYNGKITRKYTRFLRAQDKSNLATKLRLEKIYKKLTSISPNTTIHRV